MFKLLNAWWVNLIEAAYLIWLKPHLIQFLQAHVVRPVKGESDAFLNVNTNQHQYQYQYQLEMKENSDPTKNKK